MTGRLAYGYVIELSIATKVIHNIAGERKLHGFQKFALFEIACRQAISPVASKKVPTFETLRKCNEPLDDILQTYVIAVTTSASKVLPPKEELERLKAFMETDSEPHWYEV
ncbi:hypothetical protein SCHPADRAFT_907964, partial [Schizopora paradoxa]